MVLKRKLNEVQLHNIVEAEFTELMIDDDVIRPTFFT